MKVFQKLDGNFKVEFIYSPLFEMLCSLHVLTNPRHHLERLKWAEQMKENMDKRIYDEIIYFGQNFYSWLTVMDLQIYSEDFYDLNVIAAVDSINEVDEVDFIYSMLDETISTDDIKKFLGTGYTGELGITPEQMKLVSNPGGFRRRLISCLKEYYYLYFEKELRYIEPVLIRALKRHAAQYDTSGIYEYARTLHSRIEVTDEAFTFYKFKTFILPFNELKNITFIPSSFIDPHLLIGIHGKDTLNLHIRVHLGEAVFDVPLDLLNTMKALGDETRLRILRAIYRKGASTQSLSRELGLTEACISKHFKVLFEAGLLYKERKGNYIYYYLNNIMLDMIPMDIFQYLDGARAQSGLTSS